MKRDFERRVLGALLLEPQSIQKVIAADLRAEHFNDPMHRRCFDILRTTIAEDRVIDVAEIRGLCAEFSVDTEVYLSSSSTASNIERDIKAVISGFALRKMKETAHEISRWPGDSPERALQEVTDKMVGAMMAHKQSSQVLEPKEWIGRFTATLERQQRDGEVLGLQCGLGFYDKGGGLYPGRVYVIAGRPSSGKTSILLQITGELAERKRRGLFVSLEMTEHDTLVRLLAQRACVPSELLSAPWELTDNREMSVRLERAIDKHREGGFVLWAPNGATVEAVRAVALQHHRVQKLEWVALDYLQLIKAPDVKGQTREQAVAKISGGLRELSRELQAPVIALAQLNRAIESRDPPEPLLADLRDSGSIEQDADHVFMLPNRKQDADPDDSEIEVEAWVRKNRFGAPQTVKLRFFPKTQRFENF